MSFFISKRSIPEPLRYTGTGVLPNWSAEAVTESSVLEISAVLSCVSLLADSVASLPIKMIDKTGVRPKPVPLPEFLLDPAPTVTAYEFVHMIVSSLALHGNAYAYIDYVGGTRGMPRAITPLHPDNVNVTIVNSQRDYYVVGAQIPFDNMMHLRWFTPPQHPEGLSPIHQQRSTFGLSLAMDRFLGQYYGEGGTPSSVLEVDGDLSIEAAKVLQATWEAQNRKRRRPAVLSGGVKWRPISASAADMEFNESREAQINEIARIFRVPAHMINAKSASQTYTNTEQAGLQFVTYTLLPWLRRVESALTSLVPTGMEIRFDTSAFLRADTINRFRAHQLGITSGFLSPNEARDIEGLERFEGGDAFVMALPGAPMAGPGGNPDLPPVGFDSEPPQ